ncbi:MAG: T9SS type A sorting domain-containing protein [Ignavibacteria bacterium]|jgi:photosystem II stability/assembly factor-like uncharacterized protein|nr:T9SS type A sorting domain-containing protein [Ignavibacteria bacterium]
MKNIILFLFTFLFYTQTSEAQWYVQQSGTTSPLYDIEFLNKNTGWCSGEGIILKTTNGGINWINSLNDAPIKPYYAIYPVDSHVVYAAGPFRTIIKSTNGGKNWSIIENGIPGEGSYYSLFFINSLTGWAGVNYPGGAGIRKTTDGGISFNFSQTAGIPRDLYFKDSLNGVGVGEVSYIYRTTNGGNNWISSSIVFNGNLYRVSFINDNTGYTASSRAVYKTTNFGVTWDSVGHIPLTQGSVYSINFANENTGWAGTNAPVYKTTDGGRNWFLQMVTGVVYNICSINDSLVWTCGNAGRIWHTTTGGISFVNNISSFIPDNFELFQNYPNPFNGQTKISFSIKQSDIYNLEIYNSIGQKVLVVFNRQFIPGTYETNIDANTLGSGIHFYKLSGSKNSITKKFLLIK